MKMTKGRGGRVKGRLEKGGKRNVRRKKRKDRR